MNHQRLALLWTAILLAASLAAVCLVGSAPVVARAPRTAVLTVCPAGPPDCAYDSIQAAIDAAAGGDVIKVATGVYSGVLSVSVPEGYAYPPTDGTLEQVAYISKTLTLRGGYAAPGFADPPDPVANPTTIDAAGAGRGLVVWGPISATVEGLRLTGGAAGELGGDDWNGFGRDAGGCLYSSGANVLMENNHVSGCAAVMGGGVYVAGAGSARLVGNTLIGNTAQYYGGGIGGGAVIIQSTATLDDNHVTGNHAGGTGGGLFLLEGTSLLHGNLIDGNYAEYSGGGLDTFWGRVTLDANDILSNTALANYGGGINTYNTPMTLTRNLLAGNVAGWTGGGLATCGETAWLEANRFLGNTAKCGGGAAIQGTRTTFQNDVIAGNQADGLGAALLIIHYAQTHLAHVTIAGNGGGAAGLDVVEYGTLEATNTIVAGQKVGVAVEMYSTARLTATLWGDGAWANGQDWVGSGTIITGTASSWGDPAFVAPAAGDYHLGPRSAAVDAGVDAGLLTDADGEPRPRGCRPDAGADEYPGLPPVRDLHLDQVLTGSGWITATLTWSPPVEAVTYTLRISASTITDQNWAAATLLAGPLPGSAGQFTAAVPYDSGELYFALKWAGCGDRSTVSNNARWPRRAVHMPLVLGGAGFGR